jgi:drug/metabolite transporter (DMT)-like permease
MQHRTHGDRPLLGIALMLGFCVLAPMGDALAKLLGQSVPVGQIVTARFAVQAVVLIPVVWLMGLSLRLAPWQIRLIFLRTLLHIAGITAIFLSLQFLPLADAVAIAFVMPFIMLLLGKTVLGEEVGPRRLAACAVGFIGTLLVVQPSFAAVGAPALLPLFVAVVFSLFMLVTRQLAKDTDPVALQLVSGGMACAMLLPLSAMAVWLGWGPMAMVDPGAQGWGLLLAMGLLGTAAHLLMTWSLRYAPSATLAPMQYLEIPVATLIGLLVFGDFPNGLALVGIIVTMGAGLYIIGRERTVARRADG